MNRRGAEARREDEVTESVIGAAIRIHRALGPGLLESAYEECLCYELSKSDLRFERQKPLPVAYESVKNPPYPRGPNLDLPQTQRPSSWALDQLPRPGIA
jgi:hypothetical protein